MKIMSIVYSIAIFTALRGFSQKTKFYSELSITIDSTKVIDETTAKNIYTYFQNSQLFIWKDDPNNCEDRANAVSILLDSWKIPNYKVWVFSGDFLSKDNGLLIVSKRVRWKYHVATIIPIKIDNTISYITIDPSTTQTPYNIFDWASNVTDRQFSYYFLTSGIQYIWFGKGRNIGKTSFYERNDTNYEYTIQGLSGFNGLSRHDRRIMRSVEGMEKLMDTKQKFELLKINRPSF